MGEPSGLFLGLNKKEALHQHFGLTSVIVAKRDEKLRYYGIQDV